jgi:multiple sugar transport system substrate-binding protein
MMKKTLFGYMSQVFNFAHKSPHPQPLSQRARGDAVPPSPFRLPPFAIAFLALSLCGCPQSNPEAANGPKQLPFAAVKLKLQVAGDPEMAKAIERLRGEWNAQSGLEFEVVQIEEKELDEAEKMSADAAICSSQLLGVLAEKKLLAELPEKYRESSAWTEEFELPKIREAAWAGKIYGLPFGSPVLTIYYRADLLKKLQRTPPKTWAEYQEIAKLLAAEKTSTPEEPWYGTLEPLAPGWAGLTLLARAAPYAKHRDNFATWFDSKTMEPQIAEPPVVQALTRLVEAAKTNSAESLKCDPATVRRAFDDGKCGMAIGWPSASVRNLPELKGEAARESADKTAAKSGEFEVGFVELPGSSLVFNFKGKRFEPRLEEETPNVPFLGIAGRLGVVNAESQPKEAAFALLAWLSDAKNSVQVSPVSGATTLFRKSHLEKPQLWAEQGLASTAAAQYAESTATVLGRETWIDFRLPGRAEYLAALDEAVQTAVEGKSTPADALSQAAERWRQITEKLGKDRQKAAYLHSVGLE